MKIGLVRHFKVDQKIDKSFYSSEEFNKWMIDYDSANVIPNGLDVSNHDWDICFCSNLPRAITTAKHIYKDEIIITEQLQEVPLSSFTKLNLHMPFYCWSTTGRIVWYNNGSSQQETRIQSVNRAKKVLEMLIRSGNKNILVVSHGFFMKVFERVLIKNGFRGKVDLNPKNGKLYLFENNSV